MRFSLASLALLSIFGFAPAYGEGSPQIFSATYSTAFQDIDPSTGSTTDNVILANVYETLTVYHPGQNGTPDTIEPGLATEWEKSADGKVWTFHLRDGVMFHDGTPLTSSAVKFSVERTRALAGGLSFIWDAVESIDAPDDKTVVFTLSAPARWIPLRLRAMPPGSSALRPPTRTEPGSTRAMMPAPGLTRSGNTNRASGSSLTASWNTGARPPNAPSTSQ